MRTSPEQDVTRALTAVRDGRPNAVDRLFPIVYDELRRLAQHFLKGEPAELTLEATALVHEAYVRLTDQRQANWQDRAHFFAIAAQALRRVLLDHLRHRRRQKRGGGLRTLTLSGATPLWRDRSVSLIALDEALTRLADEAPLEARIVEMRFLADLSVEEIAEVLSISDRTVRRHWNFAKAWLCRELKKGGTRAAPGR